MVVLSLGLFLAALGYLARGFFELRRDKFSDVIFGSIFPAVAVTILGTIAGILNNITQGQPASDLAAVFILSAIGNFLWAARNFGRLGESSNLLLGLSLLLFAFGLAALIGGGL